MRARVCSIPRHRARSSSSLVVLLFGCCALMGGACSASNGSPATGAGSTAKGGSEPGRGGASPGGSQARGGQSGAFGSNPGGSDPGRGGSAGTAGSSSVGRAGGGGDSEGTAGAGGAGEDGFVTAGSLPEDQACEQRLTNEWAQHPPVVGFGSQNSATSYDQVFGNLLKSFGVPGGALAVSKNGRLVFSRAYGFANSESQQPAHPAQLFRVASLSKQLTAIAISKLVASGALSLNAPAFSYLPKLEPLPGKTQTAALASITIRQLLNHTGGWNRDSEAASDPMFASIAIAKALGKPGPASALDTIRYMLDKPLSYAPGSTYCYSNLGYAILGAIIEQVTGGAYETFVAKNVLEPQGVWDMKIGGSLLSDIGDDEVTYYDYPGAPLTTSIFPQLTSAVPWTYGAFSMEAMKAHGGWVASPVDFLRVAAGVDSHVSPPSLVSSQALAQMLENPNVPSCNADGSTSPASSASWYGFGYAVNQYGNYWHTGSLPGSAAENVIAKNKFNFAAFFNTRPQPASDFFAALDQDLWTAFDGVSAWSDQDYFDQYVSYSAWRPKAAFAREAAQATSVGKYASRAEGRAREGASEFRAAFAPLHASSEAKSQIGLDCVAYVDAAARYAAVGLGLASLQTFTDPGGRTRYQATWAR